LIDDYLGGVGEVADWNEERKKGKRTKKVISLEIA
jgi:hypothetical protein